jgi:hypothetical protein
MFYRGNKIPSKMINIKRYLASASFKNMPFGGGCASVIPSLGTKSRGSRI